MTEITFQTPPVREISLGVSFEPIKAIKSSHFGLFWSKIKDDFPLAEDRPPFFQAPAFIVSTDDNVLLPRVWLIHKSRNAVIQLQQDRFWFNWRRMGLEDAYPGFDSVCGQFAQWFSTFSDFLNSENIGPISLKAAELVYVNHIPIGAGWQSLADIGKVFDGIEWRAGAGPTPEPSGFAVAFMFDGDDIAARADMKSGKEKEGEQRQMFVLELRARSKSPVDTFGVALEWFERAHACLGKLFVNLTTDEIRNSVWRQQQIAPKEDR